jgi:hypothetical protein
LPLSEIFYFIFYLADFLTELTHCALGSGLAALHEIADRECGAHAVCRLQSTKLLLPFICNILQIEKSSFPKSCWVGIWAILLLFFASYSMRKKQSLRCCGTKNVRKLLLPSNRFQLLGGFFPVPDHSDSRSFTHSPHEQNPNSQSHSYATNDLGLEGFGARKPQMLSPGAIAACFQLN